MGQMTTEGSSARAEPTAEILRRVVENVSLLVDKQVELAKQEAREEARQAAAGGGMVAGGGLAVYTGLLFLLVTLCLVVDEVVFVGWGWLVALLIAALFLGAGVVLLLLGRSRLRLRPLGRTRDTLREDLEWARRQLRRNGR